MHHFLNGRPITDMFFMAAGYDGRSVTVTATVTLRGCKGLNAPPGGDNARKSVRVEDGEGARYTISKWPQLRGPVLPPIYHR